MPDLRQSFEEYRGLREALETSVLPLATSVDGRSFSFQVSLQGLELQTGGYVALETRDRSLRLGQILSLGLHREEVTDFERQVEGEEGDGRLRGRLVIRVGRGEGVVLDGDGAPFHDALVRAA